MSLSGKVLNRKDIAALVAKNKTQILETWESQSRQKVPAAKVQSRLALRDSLPQFMDQLVETLKQDNPKAEDDVNAQVARDHAKDRASQPEYTLDQVIFEYHILRAVITDFVESAGDMNSEARKICYEFIESGIRKTSTRFLELEQKRQAAQSKEIDDGKIEAERANEAKSAFLANMSHEIRTPLGAIMGFVGLLKDSGLEQDEIAKYIAIIDRNSDHLLRIIDDILDLTKVEAGKMVIETVEFSLVEFIADFSSLAGIKARENGIVFEFRTDTLLPEMIISDPTRLRQILSNVVGNAIKFTEKGKVELILKYDVHHLEIRVTDTGRGISRDQRKFLFKAFSQADSSTTRKFGGTGLGLVLTKRLSQALGGDFVLADSEIGKGSTFDVSIPVKIPTAVNMVPLKQIKVDPTDTTWDQHVTDLKGLEILLVEDSPDNQFLIKKILDKTGARITLAGNGSEGVDLALARRFDVILMDIQMPIMGGHEAVKILRAKDYSGPIVALTAHAMKEEREKAVQSGFSHFLTKPINRKSLTDLLGLLHSPLSLRL